MNNSVVKNNEKTIQKFFIVIAVLILAVYSERIIGRGLKITALYSLLCVAIITTGIVGIRSVLYKKDQIHYLYLKIAIPLLILFSFLLPPGMVPDENTHLKNIASLSSQLLGVEINHKATLTYDEYRMIYDNHWDEATRLNIKDVRKYVLSNLRVKTNKSFVALDRGSSAKDSMIYYLPAVLGLSFGRIFGMNAIISFFFARFFGMFVYLALTYYALKKMPIKKNLFFGILLMPVVLQQGMSISYDLMLNSCSFLAVSLGLGFVITPEQSRNKKNYFLYFLTAVVLIFVKSGIYSLLLLSPLILMTKRDIKNINYKQVGFVISFIVGLIAIRVLATMFTYKPVTFTNSLYSMLPWNNPKTQFMYSVNYFINHPLRLPYILLNDIRVNFGFYFRTAFSSLGWLNIQLSTALNYVWIFTFMCASCFDKDSNYIFTKCQKTIFALVLMGIAALVQIGLLLIWTPLGANHISGVQGRYFLPLILPLFMLISTSKNNTSKIEGSYLKLAFLLLAIIESLDLLYLAF